MTATMPALATDSESALLAAVLNDPAVLDGLRLQLVADDFQDVRVRLAWAAACDLADQKVAPDVRTVNAELGNRRQLSSNGASAGTVDSSWLFRTYQTPLAGDVGWHVQRVHTAAVVRRVQAAHLRLGQSLEGWERDGDTDRLLDLAARFAVDVEAAADASAVDAPIPGLATWDTFVAGVGEASRWLVPGLLRAHDTVLLLGSSGAGKSTVSRQVAVCLAAGVHPFRPEQRLEPVRTLLVDLENAPDQTAEESGPLLGQVCRLTGEGLGDRGWIWPQPEGLDLRSPVDARLLERVVAQTRPQVLCMGSLYNAYRRGADSWDHAAEDVQAVLKRLRTKYGLALWLEHHMPRGDSRGHTEAPYGGVRWEQWPTHGRVMRRLGDDPRRHVYELAMTFRNDRGRRDLPIGLVRGGGLPWAAVWSRDELAYKAGETL